MSPRISSNGPEEIDVKLTHPDRVYWPGEGVTKQGLADYYSAIWSRIEPFIVNRPSHCYAAQPELTENTSSKARVEGVE